MMKTETHPTYLCMCVCVQLYKLVFFSHKLLKKMSILSDQSSTYCPLYANYCRNGRSGDDHTTKKCHERMETYYR